MIADTPNALITYRGEIPPEIQAALEPLIEKYKVLIPSWCDHVNISYWPAPPEGAETAVADCRCHLDYRNASIRFFAAFLNYHPDQRQDDAMHEFIHITVNPLYDYACDTIKEIFKSDVLKDQAIAKNLILEGLRERVESVTTDLQKIVCQLMENK